MNEQDDRTLTSALRAVADAEASLGASAAVEQRLLAEVQSIARARRVRVRVIQLATAAAVLIAIGLPMWYASQRQGATVNREPLIADAVAQEVTTEFFPLAYSEVPAPGGYMVRMQVPRTALRSFGVASFGAPDDRSPTVMADVLVGGDGLARAVRFVQVVEN
jgi:hypothetical protein